MKFFITWFLVSWSYHSSMTHGYRDEFGIWHKPENNSYCQKDSTAMFKVFYHSDSAYQFYNRALEHAYKDSVYYWSPGQEVEQGNTCYYWSRTTEGTKIVEHVKIDSIR